VPGAHGVAALHAPLGGRLRGRAPGLAQVRGHVRAEGAPLLQRALRARGGLVSARAGRARRLHALGPAHTAGRQMLRHACVIQGKAGPGLEYHARRSDAQPGPRSWPGVRARRCWRGGRAGLQAGGCGPQGNPKRAAACGQTCAAAELVCGCRGSCPCALNAARRTMRRVVRSMLLDAFIAVPFHALALSHMAACGTKHTCSGTCRVYGRLNFLQRHPPKCLPILPQH